MWWSNPLYRNAFGIAVFIHLLLLVGFSVHPPQPSVVMNAEEGVSIDLEHSKKTENQKNLVKAISIDEKSLTEAVASLKKEREQKRASEKARQKALERQALAAENKRKKEEARLRELKRQAVRAEQQKKRKIAEEKRRLAALHKKQAEEKKRIEAMKAKQEALKKEQEQQRLAHEAAERKRAQEEEERKRVAVAAKQAKIASAADKYKVLIVNAISREWILPENADNNLSCQFEIRLGPDGSVLRTYLRESSGDAVLDRSAETAIYKASPLPVPSDPEVFEIFRTINLTVRPENVRG